MESPRWIRNRRRGCGAIASLEPPVHAPIDRSTPRKAPSSWLLTICWLLLACFLLASASPCQGDPAAASQVRVEVPYARRIVRIDAVGHEYEHAAVIRLNRRSQLVPLPEIAWKGESDASAEVRILYDEGHLYLFARVKDDDFLAPTTEDVWKSGDVLELFFNTDPFDDEEGSARFNEDDFQIVLPLHDPDRPWVAVAAKKREGNAQSRAENIESGIAGIETARRVIGDEVHLEARIPLHILPGIQKGQKELGFNLALGDRDEGGKVYNYLVWAGGLPPFNDTRNFGRLHFDGPPILVAADAFGTSIFDVLVSTLVYLLPCLLLFLLLWMARRLDQGPLAARPRLRLILGISSGVLFILAIYIPDVMGDLHEMDRRARAEEIADSMSMALPEIEEGFLQRFPGPSRDGPFVQFLSGASVRRRLETNFYPLSEGQKIKLGWQPKQYTDEGLSIFEYGMPIGEEGQKIRLHGMKAGDRIAILVSRSASADIQASPRLEIVESNQSEGNRRTLEADRRMTKMRGDRVGFFAILQVDPASQGLEVRAPLEADLRLDGVSRLPAGDGKLASQPLALGSVSSVGVPTDLRGPYPWSVGAEILPGRKLELDLPRENLDEAWFFLEAGESAEFFETPDKAIVCRLNFSTRTAVSGTSGPAHDVRDLRHQGEVFSSNRGANPELARLEQGGPTQIGYEWEDPKGGPHITPAIRIDLDRKIAYGKVTISNIGPYPLRLRSVVGARLTQDPSTPIDLENLVNGRNRGEVQLSPGLRQAIEGAEFSLFRGGVLKASSSAPGNHLFRTRLSEDLLQQLKDGRVYGDALISQGPGARDLLMPLRGEGWGGAILGISLLDFGQPAFANMTRFLRLIFMGLSLPWFLVFLLHVLAPVGSIRWQLAGVVGFGTVVPLFFLSIFLTSLLERSQSSTNQKKMQNELELVLRRLDAERVRMTEGARKNVQAFASQVAGLRTLDPAGRKDRYEEIVRELERLRPDSWTRYSFVALTFPDPASPDRMLTLRDRQGSGRFAKVALMEGGGTYSAFGKVFLAARADRPLGKDAEREMQFSWGRVMDTGLLSELSSQGYLGLYDLTGYPISIGASSQWTSGLLKWKELEKSPDAIAEKRDLKLRVTESARPVRVELVKGGPEREATISLLHGPSGKGLAMLASFEQPTAASLPFFWGPLEIKNFFIVVVGLLGVFAIYLAWIVTDRITVPIEQLENHANRISAGDLEVKIADIHAADEVSSLNRAFGEMANELRIRIRQQELRNAAVARLSARLDLDAVGEEAVHILEEACGCQSVRLLLQDRERRRVQVFSNNDEMAFVDSHGDFQDLVFEAEGVFCLPLPVQPLIGELEVFREEGLCLVFPLRIQGRRWGAVLLHFRDREDAELDLAFLIGLLGQIVSTMETARLYRLAIEDAPTGLYVARYFERQVAQELDRIRRTGGLVSWLRFAFAGPDRLRRHWGDAGFDQVLGRIGDELLHEMPSHGIAGRAALASFDLLLPETDPEQARKVGHRIRGCLMGLFERQGLNLEIKVAMVAAPLDGSSTAMLKDELERRMSQVKSGASRDKGGAVQVVRRGTAVFASTVMHKLLEDLDRVAATDLPLLIQGETGTGKEVLVDLCHEESRRSTGPLIKLNCAAIPASLMEATLFGHEKGAFTGADERKRGLFEQANGGTLFLDEIGDLPLELQAKLLRVLQSKEVLRLGSEKAIQVDVRVLAATHRDLEKLIQEGDFREDLFYRLQGFRLPVPPLRERREEIVYLVEVLREEFGGEAKEFSAEALDLLYRHPWPGNIRELHNVVQRALVLARGPFVEAEDLDLGEESGEAGLIGIGDLPLEPDGDEDGFLIPQPETLRVEDRWALLEGYLKSRSSRDAFITPRVYRSLVKVSRRTASRDLSQWLDESLLESTGRKRSLQYRLQNPDKSDIGVSD